MAYADESDIAQRVLAWIASNGSNGWRVARDPLQALVGQDRRGDREQGGGEVKLESVNILLDEPPMVGPWRIRWTRPDGDTGLGAISYIERCDADRDSDLMRRHCREGCTYVVVHDPGGATMIV